MSWSLFVARTVGRSAAHLAREAAPRESSLIDCVMAAVFGLALALVAVPTLLGRALARTVGLSVSYGVGWLIGAVVIALVVGPVATVIVRRRRRVR